MGDEFNQSFVLKPYQRKNIKLFSQKWLEKPIFSGWLAEIAGHTDKAYCKVCNCVLVAGHSELERHAAGRKHCTLMKAAQAKSSQMKRKLNQPDIPAKSSSTSDGPTGRSTTDYVLLKNVIKRERPTEEIQNSPALVNSIDHYQRSDVKRCKTEEGIPKRPNLPEQPDVNKLLKLLRSDSDDDLYDSDDGGFEDDFDPRGYQQLIRDFNDDLKYSEKNLSKDKIFAKQLNVQTEEDEIRDMTANELQSRLRLVQEKRRYQLNIYKLKLLEMKSRVRLAEEERTRAEEIHQLRTAQLQLQIQRENEFIPDEPSPVEVLASGDLGEGQQETPLLLPTGQLP